MRIIALVLLAPYGVTENLEKEKSQRLVREGSLARFKYREGPKEGVSEK